MHQWKLVIKLIKVVFSVHLKILFKKIIPFLFASVANGLFWSAVPDRFSFWNTDLVKFSLSLFLAHTLDLFRVLCMDEWMVNAPAIHVYIFFVLSVASTDFLLRKFHWSSPAVLWTYLTLRSNVFLGRPPCRVRTKLEPDMWPCGSTLLFCRTDEIFTLQWDLGGRNSQMHIV